MYRVVRIGDPPPVMELTVPELWRVIGTMGAAGGVIYAVDGDPGGLVAAGILTFLLWYVNGGEE